MPSRPTLHIWTSIWHCTILKGPKQIHFVWIIYSKLFQGLGCCIQIQKVFAYCVSGLWWGALDCSCCDSLRAASQRVYIDSPEVITDVFHSCAAMLSWYVAMLCVSPFICLSVTNRYIRNGWTDPARLWHRNQSRFIFFAVSILMEGNSRKFVPNYGFRENSSRHTSTVVASVDNLVRPTAVASWSQPVSTTQWARRGDSWDLRRAVTKVIKIDSAVEWLHVGTIAKCCDILPRSDIRAIWYIIVPFCSGNMARIRRPGLFSRWSRRFAVFKRSPVSVLEKGFMDTSVIYRPGYTVADLSALSGRKVDTLNIWCIICNKYIY